MPEIRQKGVGLGSDLLYAGKIWLGRWCWRKQKVWPRGLERRTYDPTKINLIGAKNIDLDNICPGVRVATTRRALHHPQPNAGLLRNVPDQRTNKKLAKQITKASKKEAKRQKRP